MSLTPMNRTRTPPAAGKTRERPDPGARLLEAVGQFFSRVLDGVPPADAAFELARDLVQRDRNLLGLVYALHCDGRSLVRPAIPRA